MGSKILRKQIAGRYSPTAVVFSERANVPAINGVGCSGVVGGCLAGPLELG
jgi:hypothetical protein